LSVPIRSPRGCAALAGAVLATTLAGLAGAPAALAGTAAVDGTTVRFDAAPGEFNTVTVTRLSETEYFVEDSRPIAEGPGCDGDDAPGDEAARCTSGSAFTAVSLALGDRADSGVLDDTVDVAGRLDGGDAGDVLRGGRAADLLIGGNGDDAFAGSAANDVYDGGNGADLYRQEGLAEDAGADVFNGGPGVDTASYTDFDDLEGGSSFQADEPVFLSLDDVANDGEANEGDNLLDVEDAFGGTGDDILAGNPESNTLLGGDGRDRLDGGPGIDSLGGGGDNDAVLGGDGADDLLGGTGDDGVDGGAGDDTLFGGADQDGLTGGLGDDNLDGGAGADGLFGGEGVDTVDYAVRFGDEEELLTGERVAVTLDGVADDGFAGENDNAGPDVENVSTGSGADLVTGSAAVNGILTGAGNDIVDTRDRVADSVICGAGFDTVRADGLDTVDVEGEDRCERVEVVGAQPAPPGPVPGPAPSPARVRPRSVVVTVTPGRDRRAPYRFVTRGRLSLPSGLSPATSCQGGRVSVQIKRGTRTLSTRRVNLRSNCTFSTSVSFARARRLARGTLKVTARFLGNAVLLPRAAPSRTVRAG